MIKRTNNGASRQIKALFERLHIQCDTTMQQPDGKNPEEQYVRNALSQLGKPSLWFSDITCSPETTQIPSLCLEVGRDSLFVKWQRAQSVRAHPWLLPGNISICFPSVKRRHDASRRVSSYELYSLLLSAARYTLTSSSSYLERHELKFVKISSLLHKL